MRQTKELILEQNRNSLRQTCTNILSSVCQDGYRSLQHRMNEGYSDLKLQIEDQFRTTINAERDIKNQNIQDLKSQNHPPALLVRLTEERQTQFEAEEARLREQLKSKVQLLSNRHQLRLDILAQEYGRMLQNPSIQDRVKAYMASHGEALIQSLDQGVLVCEQYHIWAMSDPSLIQDAFDCQRKDAPWRQWYQQILHQFQDMTNAVHPIFQETTKEQYKFLLNQADDTPKSSYLNQEIWLNLPFPAVIPNAIDDQTYQMWSRDFLFGRQRVKELYAEQARQGLVSLSENRNNAHIDFHRMDVFRALIALQPPLKSEKAHVLFPCLPLSIEEWSHIANDPAVDKIVLNLNTEEDPVWVPIYRSASGEWIAILPQWHAGSEFTSLMAQFLKEKWPSRLSPPTIEYGQMDPHLGKTGKQSGISEKTIWHAIMISRVLPCVLANKTQELEQYRSVLPLQTGIEVAVVYSVRAKGEHPTRSHHLEAYITSSMQDPAVRNPTLIPDIVWQPSLN